MTTGATEEETPATEAADGDGLALPTSGAADPVVKRAAILTPTRPAEAIATANVKSATRGGTAGEATGATGAIEAIEATAALTAAKGNGTVIEAPDPGETTATGASVAQIAI